MPLPKLPIGPIVPVGLSLTAVLKDEVVKFLKSEPAMHRLNFGFPTLRVYPGAYPKVADAIDRGDIAIHRTQFRSEPGAAYHPDTDSLDFRVFFNLRNWGDQALLIHECTHAYIDYLDLGKVSNRDNEALAYIAEAVFLEASGKPPLGMQEIRKISHGIAKSIIQGTYWVPPADIMNLTNEIAKDPGYSSTVIYVSNGYRRSGVFQRLFH